MKLIKAVNISLFVIALLLAVNLIQPIGSLAGNVIYTLDFSNPKCYFSYVGELNSIPIDMCCNELVQQFACEPAELNGFDFKCYVSKTSDAYYLINSKASNYCKKEGYDVKT